MTPGKKDFFTVGGDFRVKFERNARGAVTGFLISTGRVLNLKFAKVKR